MAGEAELRPALRAPDQPVVGLAVCCRAIYRVDLVMDVVAGGAGHDGALMQTCCDRAGSSHPTRGRRVDGRRIGLLGKGVIEPNRMVGRLGL